MPRLTVAGTDVAVETQAGEPILKALSRSGYSHRFGCRRGGCGICKVVLVSGEVDYPDTVCDQVLSEAEQDSGLCLTCRAVPRTDAVIRLTDNDKLRCIAPLLATLVRSVRPPKEQSS
ncbi:MAG: 2Fe-2S iron-sulfur cluster-binding protein [Jatrophihabitans sp.]|uniref:2Fe-2S iron-sulfur cluster-binding protein n=1 Tax=Jatrophihabitans sp. TaxID=1932789 RepID=UPI003F7ECE94